MRRRAALRVLSAGLTAAVFLAASPAVTAYAGTWREENGAWYYHEVWRDVTGWKRIPGADGVRRWYWFDEDGRLGRNTDTPDGFHVNGDGVFDGVSAQGMTNAFAAAEKALEAAQQAYERDYYAKLRAAAAAREAAAAAQTGAAGPGAAESAAGESGAAGTAVQEKAIPAYTSLFRRAKYGEMLKRTPSPKLSGLRTGGMPAEFFMLCVAGETSGAAEFMSSIVADKGRAYGLCQYDYRYDLVDFLKYAFSQHPLLWTEAAAFLHYADGDIALVENAALKGMFRRALLTDPETALSDQLTFMRMLYWDDFAREMNAAGFHLNDRNIAVQAALFSVNVNCGPQAEVFIKELRPEISDQEFLDRIYEIRNTIFAEQLVQGLRKKGTSDRYLKGEPEMAVDLMYGNIGLDSELDYGGGVEWYGNPF